MFCGWPRLVFHPVKPRPDGHGLDLSSPVHTLVVGPGLAQGLVQSSLELLDPHHHIEMSLGVLLYHVPHVVGFSGLQVFIIITVLQLSSIKTPTCWNFRLATKYLIFLINLTAFLCANVKLDKSETWGEAAQHLVFISYSSNVVNLKRFSLLPIFNNWLY